MSAITKCGIRGALIVFEGCDRSGKSTQCAKLAKRLVSEGMKVQLMKFPDRTTPIGQMIDNYLKQSEELDDHAIHLLFSANRWEAMQKMIDLLQAGVTLIVDRYAYSGVAYTAAKGLPFDWCCQSDIGLVKPDMVIYLVVNRETSASRAQFGIERYERSEFQQRVSDIYHHLQDTSYWQVVNGESSVDKVHTEVYDAVIKAVNISRELPIQRLWTDENIPKNVPPFIFT